MSDSPMAVWSVFITGVLAAVILLAGVVVAIVVSQRRYVNLHRSHARRILEAQEEERAWVAREVHDDAVQRLALIGRECGSVTALDPPVSTEQANRLRAIQTELTDLSAFLRGLAHRLHPTLIDRGGLRAALTGLGEDAERAYGVKVALRLPPPNAVIPAGAQRAVVLYRLAQEALQNVVKHAGVPAATLELKISATGLELRISDAGRGFSPDRIAGANGLGLIGMKERAYLAGGSVSITSRPGAGTVVLAEFPPEKEAGP